MVPQKFLKFVQVPVMPKSSPFVTVFDNRNGITRCNFFIIFEGFIQAMVCSCAPMFIFFPVLPDVVTIDYKISNRGFFYFLCTYYCDFLNNVYRQGSVFSCGKKLIGPAGIAVPQIMHCFCFLVLSCSLLQWLMIMEFFLTRATRSVVTVKHTCLDCVHLMFQQHVHLQLMIYHMSFQHHCNH